jgi:uncharacterized phage infection (PIP) family protein YhgE
MESDASEPEKVKSVRSEDLTEDENRIMDEAAKLVPPTMDNISLFSAGPGQPQSLFPPMMTREMWGGGQPTSGAECSAITDPLERIDAAFTNIAKLQQKLKEHLEYVSAMRNVLALKAKKDALKFFEGNLKASEYAVKQAHETANEKILAKDREIARLNQCFAEQRDKLEAAYAEMNRLQALVINKP